MKRTTRSVSALAGYEYVRRTYIHVPLIEAAHVPLFRSKNYLDFNTLVLSFLFDKHCPIIE